MKYTRPPWKAEKSMHGIYHVHHGICRIASVAMLPSDREQEMEANAHLIAAAPDLLEACQAFVTAYEKSLQLEKTDTALRLARAAIEKATAEKEQPQ